MVRQIQEKVRPSDTIFTPELSGLLCDYAVCETESREAHRLKDQIVRKALPYVRKIAHGLARRSTDPVDDIIQVGTIGLIKAIEKFNPLAGTSFKTYATYLITGEIRHYLRDKTAMIKTPRQIYELYYRINQIVDRLSKEYSRTPTDLEIADFLQCSVDKIAQAQEVDRRKQTISLDQFVTSSSSDNGHIERLVDDKYFEFLQTQEIKLTLEKAMLNLKDELKTVVEMTYYEDLSQAEIAKALGISQMQVSRRLRKALEVLSQRLQGTQETPLSS